MCKYTPAARRLRNNTLLYDNIRALGAAGFILLAESDRWYEISYFINPRPPLAGNLILYAEDKGGPRLERTENLLNKIWHFSSSNALQPHLLDRSSSNSTGKMGNKI